MRKFPVERRHWPAEQAPENRSLAAIVPEIESGVPREQRNVERSALVLRPRRCARLLLQRLG
jgi:hypothetical protein